MDGYATSSGTPGTPGQLPLTSFRTLPAKSNLKRRLIDCMESDESQGNVDEPLKKKRNIHFDAVTVYYFPRAQGFTCVPSQVRKLVPFFPFQPADELCVTYAICLPFVSISRLPGLREPVSGSPNAAFKFRIFSVHCSGNSMEYGKCIRLSVYSPPFLFAVCTLRALRNCNASNCLLIS